MSALSIPASSGYGAVSLVKSEASPAQQQTTEQPVSNSTRALASLPRFSNPHIYIDPTSNQVVFETRDSETGKLTNQLPSSIQLRAYRLQQSLLSSLSSTNASIQAAQLAAKPIVASGKTVLAA